MLYKYTLDRTEIKETRPAIPNADISVTFKRIFEPGWKGWEDKPRSGWNQDGGERRMDQDYYPVRKLSPFPGVPNIYKQPSFCRKSFSNRLISLAEKWLECR